MITYRAGELFEARFGRTRADACPERELEAGNRFQVERYLDHQGRKLVSRFDARSYVALSRAMDLHDVARGRESLAAALAHSDTNVVSVGISSDVLFAPAEMESAARHLRTLGKAATYAEVHSLYGHDAFLVEYGQVGTIVKGVLNEVIR